MHAYAIQDPVFNTLNTIGLSQTGGLLGEFCVKCHAPIATQMSEAEGGILRPTLSAAGARGVTCAVCHMSEAQTPGQVIGQYRLDGILYGPISDPVPNKFHGSQYRAGIEQSSACSGCHEVINTRGIRVEGTFSEWQNSLYPARNIPCQVCHMKYDSGFAAVGGSPKRRLHSHVMEGLDVPLTDFPGRDEMIQRVQYMMNNSVHTEFLPPTSIARGKDVDLDFEITNSITGHNVPSGTIFERQMWVEMLVTNENGDTLLYSGGLDPNGDLLNEKSDFVKNHQMSRDSSLVLFNGTAMSGGEEIPFFFAADAVVNHSIPPFQLRHARYLLTAARIGNSSTIHARARMFARALPPYLLRALGHGDLVDRVPVFSMEEREADITVN